MIALVIMDWKQEVSPNTGKRDHILDKIIARRLRFKQLIKHCNLLGVFFLPSWKLGRMRF